MTNLMLVAAGALIDTDGRVLICRRPEGRALSGLWEFPGGKLQEGESPEVALARELEEELGIKVRPDCMAAISFVSHDYNAFHLLMPLFAVRKWTGIPQPLEKQTLKWVWPAELNGYAMPPADLPLIAALTQYL